MSSRAKTVAVADGVWEEVAKHVVLTVHHSLEQSFVDVLGKLLRSGIFLATETEPDRSADECIDSLFI